jgi:hypothetical protein
LVCSWALRAVRVVVIGTFFGDGVRLLCNRAVRAEGVPGGQYRRNGRTVSRTARR